MSLERTSRYVGGDASIVTQARHWLRAELKSALPRAVEVGQDAELVLSELVTNSVRAACGECQVTLVVSQDTVRLDVFDDAPGIPQLVEFEPNADHGRGLAIVAQLSREWGVESVEIGKHVWALLDVVQEPIAMA